MLKRIHLRNKGNPLLIRIYYIYINNIQHALDKINLFSFIYINNG